MKLFRFSVLLFVLHTSVLLPFFSSNISASLTSDMSPIPNHSHIESSEGFFSDTPSNRKLKLQDNEHSSTPRRNSIRVADVNLNDYGPIDPAPCSKTSSSIKHGPIEHDSPLIPHMPNPSPPAQPPPGGFV